MVAVEADSDEAVRLAALHGLRLLDSAPEERFDRITRLVCQALQVPFAQIGLLDSDRLWYKSNAGLTVVSIAREDAVCTLVVLADTPIVVDDLRGDSRFADKLFVAGPPYLRAYAGLPLHGAQGKVVGALCALDTEPRAFTAADLATLRDLSALAEEELRRSRQIERASVPLIRALINNLADSVFTFDAGGVIQSYNQAAAALFGYAPDAAIGLPIAALIPDLGAPASRWLVAGADPPPRDALGRRANGDLFPIDLTTSTVAVAGETAHVAVVRDETERKQTEADLRRKAFYDAVTNLPNRVLFADRLGAALEAASGTIAVLYLDLDGFKAINDAHGHAAGDQLLLAAGRRLTSRLRPGDTVARVGGDEFALLLMAIPGAREAQQLADRLIDHLRRPFNVEGHTVTVSASIGIALAEPGGMVERDRLVRAADAALYRAKTAGKDRAVVFGDPRFDWRNGPLHI
jgi:diguanylate cyclase (GGDEF)-like protein/PAS domain S-box-containing protein